MSAEERLRDWPDERTRWIISDGDEVASAPDSRVSSEPLAGTHRHVRQESNRGSRPMGKSPFDA